MVSLNILLLTTILLVSEGYGQLAGCGCYPQPTPSYSSNSQPTPSYSSYPQPTPSYSSNSQRCGCGSTTVSAGYSPVASTPSIIPCGQFIVPAIIKPLICPSSCSGLAPAPAACAPSRTPPCAPCSPAPVPAPCANNDDGCELDRLLYQLISQIIENRKCSSKKSGYSSSFVYDDSSDYGAVGSYGDDYEYGQCQPSAYCPPGMPSSCDSSGPEITVYVRQCDCS